MSDSAGRGTSPPPYCHEHRTDMVRHPVHGWLCPTVEKVARDLAREKVKP